MEFAKNTFVLYFRKTFKGSIAGKGGDVFSDKAILGCNLFIVAEVLCDAIYFGWEAGPQTMDDFICDKLSMADIDEASLKNLRNDYFRLVERVSWTMKELGKKKVYLFNYLKHQPIESKVMWAIFEEVHQCVKDAALESGFVWLDNDYSIRASHCRQAFIQS